jgi:hypothetical protein
MAALYSACALGPFDAAPATCTGAAANAASVARPAPTAAAAAAAARMGDGRMAFTFLVDGPARVTPR